MKGAFANETEAPRRMPGQLQQLAQILAAQGRHGDTELVHVNQDEVRKLLEMGGRGSVNPATGLREFPPANAGGDGTRGRNSEGGAIGGRSGGGGSRSGGGATAEARRAGAFGDAPSTAGPRAPGAAKHKIGPGAGMPGGGAFGMTGGEIKDEVDKQFGSKFGWGDGARIVAGGLLGGPLGAFAGLGQAAIDGMFGGFASPGGTVAGFKVGRDTSRAPGPGQRGGRGVGPVIPTEAPRAPGAPLPTPTQPDPVAQLTRLYQPYTGDYTQYGYQPMHEFFKSVNGG